MTDSEDQPTPPTVSIYQNPDHVSGILQQAYNTGLLTGEQRDHEDQSSQSTSDSRQGDAGAKAGVTVPGIVEFGFNLDGGLSHATTVGQDATARSSQNFIYSQAFYLYHVRRALIARQQLKHVTDVTDSQTLESGDFVEFQASFKPNELSAILDILTPDMIRAAVYYKYHHDGVELFSGFDTFDEVQRFSFELKEKANANADLASAIASAVRVDFRSGKTREYYGAIASSGDAVTAITICDAAHFTVDDEDRILDGNFKVLGKVTSPLTEDVPVLERNKILDRLNPKLVDHLFGSLRDAASKQALQLEERAISSQDDADSADDEEDTALVDPFDLALESRIIGPSFRVIPIAIYI